MPAEFTHEPHMALSGGDDGLDLVRTIIDRAPDFLNPGGHMVCEIGYGREAVEEAYPHLPFLWLDTENSEGEVFWISREQLTGEEQ
jgi:ribosomal protein L3 glutamine methyltransferase